MIVLVCARVNNVVEHLLVTSFGSGFLFGHAIFINIAVLVRSIIKFAL